MTKHTVNNEARGVVGKEVGRWQTRNALLSINRIYKRL